MSDLDNVGSTKDLIAGYKAKIERLQETVEELSNKNKEFIKQSHHEQAKLPTMYEVTFESDGYKDVVLILPFMPQKGNQFRLFESLIFDNGAEAGIWNIKVKSIESQVSKDGKISNIYAISKPIN